MLIWGIILKQSCWFSHHWGIAVKNYFEAKGSNPIA